jgi:hypothetical protein
MMIRARSLALVLLASAGNAVCMAAQPAEAAHDLIRDVVFNELRDHQQHGYWQYQVQKKTPQQTLLQEEIETNTGRVNRLIATNGVPLNARQQQQENERLVHLLNDRGQQAKLKQQYDEDERHIGSMMRLLPDAFLYQYDGAEGDQMRLRFQPNPAFKPPTYEGRIFHSMAGMVWVSMREKRLARLRGQLIENVDFGYGLLGRLYKGGTFEMERREVSAGNWKTYVLDVHISGHVILLKSIGKDQREVRTEFRPVPAGLNVAQAAALLDETVAKNERGPAHMQPIALRSGAH